MIRLYSGYGMRQLISAYADGFRAVVGVGAFTAGATVGRCAESRRRLSSGIARPIVAGNSLRCCSLPPTPLGSPPSHDPNVGFWGAKCKGSAWAFFGWPRKPLEATDLHLFEIPVDLSACHYNRNRNVLTKLYYDLAR